MYRKILILKKITAVHRDIIERKKAFGCFFLVVLEVINCVIKYINALILTFIDKHYCYKYEYRIAILVYKSDVFICLVVCRSIIIVPL